MTNKRKKAGPARETDDSKRLPADEMDDNESFDLDTDDEDLADDDGLFDGDDSPAASARHCEWHGERSALAAGDRRHMARPHA